MSHRPDIYVVGTERFFNNYSKQSTSGKLDDVTNFCQDKWQTFIEDGSGSYKGDFITQYQSDVEVPESALRDDNDLSKRLYDADDWLDNNFKYYGNDLNVADSIVVVDYYGQDSGTYGWGYIGTAGNDNNICGLVDTEWEDTDSLPLELSLVDSEGVAFHEMLHTFGARHPDDVTTDNYDYCSYMFSWDGADCDPDGNTDQVANFTSNCTESGVRSYVDNNST